MSELTKEQLDAAVAFVRGDGLFQNTLKRNAAMCKLCGIIVESRSRHESKSCTCGNITVDGGLAYARRMWRSDQWVELAEDADPCSTS